MRCAVATLVPLLVHAEVVAPVEVVFAATIAPAARERLWSRIQDGLAENGFDLLPEAGTQEKLTAAAVPAGCVVGPCLKAVGAALSVKYALVAHVDAIGSSFDIVLTVMETERGAPVAQATERCDVCSMMDVEASVKRAAEAVAAALLAAAEPPPAPPPAVQPEVVAAAPERRPEIWRWPGWKWVAAGVGVAAAGLGTYLVQIDGCTNDACTDRRSTGTPGMIAVGSGVVMMGGAAYLFAFGF